VHLFAKSLTELDASQVILVPERISCQGSNTWQYGNSLANYMKLAQMEGVSGKVSFDAQGLRTSFDLEVIELKAHGLEKVIERAAFRR